MHSYLRAIGFSNIKHRQEIDKLIKAVIGEYDKLWDCSLEDNHKYYEIRKSFGPNMGIAIRGCYSDGHFETDYYYPYLEGFEITTNEHVEMEKASDKEAITAIVDDIRVGVSILYFVQNIWDCYNNKKCLENGVKGNSNISGLSVSGKILFPIIKAEEEIENSRKTTRKRNHLLAAAREGNEDAIESLTLEDIDVFSEVSRRALNEDIYSLIDTYFMPYGVESDKYSIMGEILGLNEETNSITNETVFVMKIECNDLIFDLCINKEDLCGEPAVGRRFKGLVWLQGSIDFE